MGLFKRRNKSYAPEEQKKDVELQEELDELTAAQPAHNVDKAVNEAERTISDATMSDIRDIALIERGRCPECGSRTEMLVSSRVCPTCGWYRWRAQEANSCIVYLETGEKINCDKIYNVKGNNVLCIMDDVVRHLVSQRSILRIDYVWDEEKLEVAQERFYKEQTGVCDWCGIALNELDEGQHVLEDHAALGTFQEKYRLCSERCLASFRRQYPTRIHRNCYETDCNVCNQCVRRYDTTNIVRYKLTD